MTDEDRSPTSASGGDGDVLTWRVRRCTQKPFMCALVVLFELVLGLGVYIRYSPALAGLALLFVTLALLPFYGAYRYVLSPERIEIFGPLYTVAHHWNEFDGWRLDEDELRLTARNRPRRHVLVIYSPRNIEVVVRYVSGHIPVKLEDRRM